MTNKLRLKCEGVDDVPVLSSLVQDAIVKVGEITYNGSGRALSFRLSRFRHETDQSERILSGLRVDNVLNLKSQNITRDDPDALMVLLAISACSAPDSTEMDGGDIDLTFTFAGDGVIKARVEMIDMLMVDVSAPRATRSSPLHPLDITQQDAD